ncbi:ECF sigma factor VreI [Aliidongia dinghuensis]|uniref:ECF sigma factor VreI n=1 Tax=Aliidongia dinghuensis TaxID=1867774 RepID=A0A8J3E765_9PROT|nr:RNA polymerase sigma factor [Aliidongia dinghuensis]GGF51584.1 ECF sigma factor VreI [Aliidongia dinghuensis]
MLRQLLADDYDDLKLRLTRRLGSTEFASEVLHETWLRLERQPGEPSLLRNPRAYLFRVALNIAKDRRQADSRRLTLAEIDALRRADRDELDPARIATARADIESLIDALQELPDRCRAIFVAARVEELPHRDIAQHFGISTRMVERELRRALAHCRARLEINLS